MKRAALVAAALILLLGPATPVAAAPDPLACTGYPEPRTFLEVQSWWEEPGIAEPMHLHAGTCFPLGQNMSGTSTFDVRVMMHFNPGKLFALSFDFYSGYEQYINVPDVTCGIANTCTYWYQVTVNWSQVPAGWRELRLKPRVMFPKCGPNPCDEDAGATQITSSGWPIQVRGGTSGNRSSSKYYVESRGWYEHDGYQNVQVNDWRMLQNPLSGTVSIPVKLNCGCGGDDSPTTRSWAVVDPDFHASNPGVTVLGPINGKFTSSISLDTTQFTNGPHKLVLLASTDHSSMAVPGRLTGVGVYPFYVSN